MQVSVGEGGRGVAAAMAVRGGMVCCSWMAASASLSEGSWRGRSGRSWEGS